MKKILSIIIIIFLLLLSSCSSAYTEKSVFALDTVITFHTTFSDVSRYSELIRSYEKIFSRTDAASELYKLNGSVSFTPSDELFSLIEYSVGISEKTDGAFDITAKPLTDLWNINSKNPSVPEKSQIEAAVQLCGYEKLSLTDKTVKKPLGTGIDLGAVAKGYVAQKIVEAMRADGCKSGFVSFGGNIAVVNEKTDGYPWVIGIKDPRNTSGIVGTVNMSDGYLSVSGDYERYFIYEDIRYHHIFDVATGYPAKNGIISVAVISSDGALSDALSTALFVMGEKRALELYKSGIYDFEAVIMLENKTVIATPGAEFKLSGKDWTVKK